MKKLFAFLILLLAVLVAAPASALYTCSGPPVAQGTVGLKSGAAPNPQYVSGLFAWTGPPAESFALAGYTNFGGPARLSFGAGSGAVARFGGSCTINGLTCSTWPSGRATTWKIDTQFLQEQKPDGTYQSVSISRWTVNGLKVMELYGLGALTGLQNTATWSDGVSVIRQDNGVDSSFWFEGWHNGAWKSVRAKFSSNQCGST